MTDDRLLGLFIEIRWDVIGISEILLGSVELFPGFAGSRVLAGSRSGVAVLVWSRRRSFGVAALAGSRPGVVALVGVDRKSLLLLGAVESCSCQES